MSFPENTDYRGTPYVSGPASPYPYQQVGPQTFAPPPHKKKSRAGLVAGIIGASLALLCGGVVVAAALSGDPAKTPTASATTADRPAAQPAEPAKTYPTPTATDFALAVKVTKKQCFGSAGCNIDFTIGLDYKGPALEPNSSWDITFDMSGVEDPYTATLHMTVGADGVNGDYEQDGDQQVQTKSSKAVLKAVVTSVSAA